MLLSSSSCLAPKIIGASYTTLSISTSDSYVLEIYASKFYTATKIIITTEKLNVLTALPHFAFCYLFCLVSVFIYMASFIAVRKSNPRSFSLTSDEGIGVNEGRKTIQIFSAGYYCNLYQLLLLLLLGFGKTVRCTLKSDHERFTPFHLKLFKSCA